MNYKYHYVYRITNVITEMFYYGDRSCNCHPSEDIGIKYFSTSSLKLFINDQKENPQDYKYKIVRIFESCRTDAKQLEVELHKRFDVKNNKKFINRSNQTSSGFSNGDISGEANPMFGRNHTEESKAKMSENSKWMTGDKNHMFNKHHTDESKKKMSDSLTGIGLGVENSFYGKTHSDKQKEKWSEDRKGTRLGTENSFYGKTHSDETKKKISEMSKNMIRDNIKIYDNKGDLKFECEKGFKPFCETNGIPYNALSESYRNNGRPLAPHSKTIHFKGWYAIRTKKVI